MLKMKNYNYDCAKFYTLNELVDFRNGKGHEKNIVQDGEYIVVNSKFISTDGEVKKFSNSQICPVYKNDILMVMSDLPNGRALAKCFLVEEDNKYTLNQRIGAFKVKREDIINTRYLFYCLNRNFQLLKFDNGVDQTNLRKDDILKIRIPVPPLEVQCEIVHILDEFTLLSAELSAELSARKRQYEFYRNKLLSFENVGDVEYKTIGELSEFRRGSFPQPYGNSEWYDGEGAMPFVQVADIGNDMKLVEDTKRKISKLAQPKSVFAPKGSIVISLQGSIGRVAETQYDAYIDRTVAIFNNLSDTIIPRYFVYQIQNIFAIKEKTARGSTIKTITKEEFTNFDIPVPSIERQKEIVEVLDNFNKICADIYDGLPAEIKAREQQYSYYRDRLLSFKEVDSDV